MDSVDRPEKGTYIIGVSGGVDSVVLLDILARQSDITLVVAHFDHDMRPDSSIDEQFVASLAGRYQLAYESEQGQLGLTASEATARQARYNFLFRTQQKYNARSVITAHHADDIIETMIINLIRGTGWRGLCSLQSDERVQRPLLPLSKIDIIGYAKEHSLHWREDPTNSSQAYLRNAVRHELTPLVNRQAWLDLYESQKTLADKVDQELKVHQSRKRYDYIMLPPLVALEVVKRNLSLTRSQASRALLAIKTAKPGTDVTIGGGQVLTFTRDTFIVGAARA